MRDKLIRRGTAAIVAAFAATMLVVGPAAAGEPTAQKSGEELVSYLTKGKLKPAKRISYKIVCNADCSVTATSKLKLSGPDIGPVSNSGSFPAGTIIEVKLTLNKAAKSAIRENIGAAKLVTSVTATDLTTAETDTDKRNFKFKR